jgi:hypothetical protein
MLSYFTMKFAHFTSMFLLVCVTTATQGSGLSFCQANQSACHGSTKVTKDSCCPTKQKQTPPDCCILLTVDNFLPIANTHAPTSVTVEVWPHNYIWEGSHHLSWRGLQSSNGPRHPWSPPHSQQRRACLGVYLI